MFLPGMEQNRIGVLGGISQFHTSSIPGKFELACNKCAYVHSTCSLIGREFAILCSVLCSDLVEHIESISTILC